MEPRIILLLCAAGIFVVILAVYIIVEYRRKRYREKTMAQLVEAYSDDKLQKMEYDVAFYDDDIVMPVGRVEKQVTIDDVLTSSAHGDKKIIDAAIFARVDDEGVEEITGNYNPDQKN